MKFFSAASKVSSKAAWIWRVGLADEAVELLQRLLEVGPLLLELVDVLERVLVLALGQRVHRAELLAAARDPLELALDLLALLVAERLVCRADLAAEPRPDPLELARRLGAALAQVRGRDLGLGHRLARRPQPRLKLRLLARALPQLPGEVVGLTLAQHPALERGGALAGGVAGGRDRLAEPVEQRQHRVGLLEARLERALAAAPEQLLEPPRGAGRELGGVAQAADLDRALGLRGAAAGAGEGAAGDLERLADPLEPGLDRIASLVLFRAQLLGQRPERRSAALDLGRERGAARRERLGADGEPLVRGADRGQPAPGLGALAVAGGELLLDRGAAAVDLGQLGLDRVALRARLGGAALGAGEALVVGAQLGREHPRPQLVRVALEPRVDVGGLRLALQRPQAAAGLALDVEGAVEVVLGALELELGAAAALAVLAEPGGLLDQQAAVARLRVDDLLDPALADHRVHLAPEAGVGEPLDHVGEPAAGAVQPVGAVTAAVEAPAHRDLGEIRRRVPSELSSTTSTSAARDGPRPSPPAKIMSCIAWPRTFSGLCSPSAQSTASVTFDLPQPFGPTMTLTPGEKTSRVRSGKDLKPLIVIELRCMVGAAGGDRLA